MVESLIRTTEVHVRLLQECVKSFGFYAASIVENHNGQSMFVINFFMHHAWDAHSSGWPKWVCSPCNSRTIDRYACLDLPSEANASTSHRRRWNRPRWGQNVQDVLGQAHAIAQAHLRWKKTGDSHNHRWRPRDVSTHRKQLIVTTTVSSNVNK